MLLKGAGFPVEEVPAVIEPSVNLYRTWFSATGLLLATDGMG